MLKFWQLRAHIAGLAAAARRTRREENKHYSLAELLRIQDRLTTGQFKKSYIEKTIRRLGGGRIKGGSDGPLSLRERIIDGLKARGGGHNTMDLKPVELQKLAGITIRAEELHNWRVNYLRKESRAALLAYGFLRGKAVHDMEMVCREPLPAARVRHIAENMSGDAAFDEEAFLAWMADYEETRISYDVPTHPLPVDAKTEMDKIDERLLAAENAEYRKRLMNQQVALAGKLARYGTFQEGSNAAE